MESVKGPIGKCNKLLKKKFGRKRFLIPIYFLFLSITIGFIIANILEFYGQKIATEIQYKQQERIAIPEIVLCSSKWQNKTRMEEDGVSVELMEYLKFGFLSPINYHPTNRRPVDWDLREAAFRTWLQNPKNRGQFGNNQTLDYANFFMEMSHYCKKFLGTFRLENIRTREPGCSYFRKVLTDTGICIELKPDRQLSQGLPGPAGGIQFVSYVSNALEPPTLFHSSLEDGVHIHINGEWIPTINSAPTFIPAGSRAYIKLSAVKKTKILGCIPDEQKRRLVHLDREYSREGCIYECAINKTLENCGCTLFTYNIKLPLDKFCPPKLMKDCVKPIMDNRSELMRSCTEKCLPNCVITRMEVSVSYARNDNGKVNEYSRRFNTSWQANKSVSVLIYFGELTVVEVKEFWTISLSTLFSNIGGQVGLWMGASVLGLVAIFLEWFPVKKIQERKQTAGADDSHISPSATETV